MLASAAKRVTQRVTTSSLNAVPRRFASSKYAHMKVKKNNWIEQNEVFRENKYQTWKIEKNNLLGLVVMVFAFPTLVHSLVKSEYAIREEKQGIPVHDRL